MRIRTIKPEFWESESLGRVSREARLLFIGLFSCCDDSGKTRANSRLLASRLFPYDEDSLKLLDGWLKELSEEGCVRLYHVNGDTFLDIPKWLSHQKIDKPSKSKLPDFVEDSRPFAEPSRKIALEQGTGNREQGTGNRDMSGTPDVAPLPAKSKRFEEARSILQLLNELTGSHFREVDSNLSLITARLQEPDVSAEGVRLMVQRQVAKWKTDPKMADFLRPETLFGKQKFDSYYAARELPIQQPTPTNGNGTNSPKKEISVFDSL